MTTQAWWKEVVIYQIYPRSFNDSNADGIGDLRGIVAKLPYLKNLGVDVLWLSPCFASPNVDNGYDVSDYEAIMPEFGTMTDFDALLQAAQAQGLKIILDLVVNHSSDQHRWFEEARKSKDNPYRDYYIWQPPAPNGGLPNDWISFFSGPAWTLDPPTGEYYLHLFAKQQPDLNWENPALRQEIYQMMRFWLNKGVDGFRMDVIPFLSKDTNFANYPEGRFGDLAYYANGPRIHEFLQEMHQEVLQHYDCLTVGEGFGVMAEQANLYVGQSRRELQMIYHFDHAVPREEARFLDPAPEFTPRQLRQIFDRWHQALGQEGWQNIYFGNHDNPRMLSRFGSPDRYRYESATMLATVLLTQRGTPSLYQGDELGMGNCRFERVEDFDDVQVKNAYQNLKVAEQGLTEQFLAACNRIARDHARTLLPWHEANQNPIFDFYQNLIQLRKTSNALKLGHCLDLDLNNNQVWAYTRQFEQETWLIVCNFTDQKLIFELPPHLPLDRAVWRAGNYAPVGLRAILSLKPYEALVYQLFLNVNLPES